MRFNHYPYFVSAPSPFPFFWREVPKPLGQNLSWPTLGFRSLLYFLTSRITVRSGTRCLGSLPFLCCPRAFLTIEKEWKANGVVSKQQWLLTADGGVYLVLDDGGKLPHQGLDCRKGFAVHLSGLASCAGGMKDKMVSHFGVDQSMTKVAYLKLHF